MVLKDSRSLLTFHGDGSCILTLLQWKGHQTLKKLSESTFLGHAALPAGTNIHQQQQPAPIMAEANISFRDLKRYYECSPSQRMLTMAHYTDTVYKISTQMIWSVDRKTLVSILSLFKNGIRDISEAIIPVSKLDSAFLSLKEPVA